MGSALQRSLEAGAVTVTAEVMPPRGGDPSHTLAMANLLRDWVQAINVTDGSRAVMRMSSLAVCRLLLDAGLEPVLQMAGRDRNRIGIQADLLGAHALGIRNLLCLTGDSVKAGDQPSVRPVHELESVRLLQQVSSFNRGEDPVKESLPDGPTALFAGAAADPHCASWSGLKRRLERKREAGARFVQTQMVMDPQVLERFCRDMAAPMELPVLAGVFLLKSARNASFINQKVPGANIPDSLIARLDAASDPAAEGIAIAAEQVRQFAGIAQGVHVMAVRAEERIPEVLERAGLSSQQL
ncbi:5/10-methylenetetrahydrofolate reductase [Synechococcus sp. MIT S9220]|uniref:methylenetetrahydrofolate reductase n=1 Tax=unclassified Synechococcus TaxID=2626047 RepID=UPI00164A9C0C|nr:methylenetetrahydrofolate reductase [Synechococcus sp. MIT S9220]NOL48443.1 methylenetetrahydrofolate reductase [Synechococcus sp. MIT S9220]QNJ24097.1 5/10-methylenetetrahydrofolate reductase [Synechococcus sp. MIT S9220]